MSARPVSGISPRFQHPFVIAAVLASVFPLASRPSFAQDAFARTSPTTAPPSTASTVAVGGNVGDVHRGAITVRGGMPQGFFIDGSSLRVLPGYHFKKTSDSLGTIKGQRGNTGTISCDCTGDGAGCTVTFKDGRVFCDSGGCMSGCIAEITIPPGDGGQSAQPGRVGKAPASTGEVSLPNGAPEGLLIGGDRVVVKTGYTFRRISDLKGTILDSERDGTGTVTCEPCAGAGSCTLSYKEGSLFCSKSCDKSCGMVITIPSDDEDAAPARVRMGG